MTMEATGGAVGAQVRQWGTQVRQWGAQVGSGGTGG